MRKTHAVAGQRDQSVMESKFRPIPITILDFLGILFPGFVWLILIITSIQLFLDRDVINSPIYAWQLISSTIKTQDSWLALLTLLTISILIGYMLKPSAMLIAQHLTIYLFKFADKTRKIPSKDMIFPFNVLFEKTAYYKEVKKFIHKLIRCSPDGMYGNQLFSSAKRYLRLVAPSLWEESERMEAEVRMSGAMLLACLYSLVLSSLTLVLQYAGIIRNNGHAETWCWLVLSFVVSIILGFGFNRLRIREVSYTYMNALIASGCQPLLNPKVTRSTDEKTRGSEG